MTKKISNMKQKTINQLNSYLQNNPTVQYYLQLSAEYEKYQTTNYRNRYFNFWDTWKTANGERATVKLRPAGFIYGAAMREFNRATGAQVDRYDLHHRREYFELQCSTVLQFQITLGQDLTGVYLQYETNFKPMRDNNHKRYRVKSNSTFVELDIRAYFEQKILQQYMYAPGLFRNIQIIFNCSKSEARAHYLRMKSRTDVIEEVSEYKAWRQLFKNRLNIQIEDDFSLNVLPAAYRSLTRQKSRKKLFKHPSPFELSEMYLSQYDSDDDAEEFLNDFYSDYPKNAIFF